LDELIDLRQGIDNNLLRFRVDGRRGLHQRALSFAQDLFDRRGDINARGMFIFDNRALGMADQVLERIGHKCRVGLRALGNQRVELL
jgi:hypothetical protein